MDFLLDRGVAKLIDHSLLSPSMTDQILLEGVEVARRLQVATLCVKPYWVEKAVRLLAAPSPVIRLDVNPIEELIVPVSTVIAFPHGASSSKIKVVESLTAIEDGASELDVVVNIGKVLSGDWEYVRADIGAVIEMGKSRGVLIKVIFENCYLEDRHKIKLCEICENLAADFIKTSTGFGPTGYTSADLKLMRSHVSDRVQIKASGGIRTLKQLLEARELGAARIGTSSSLAILEELRFTSSEKP